MMTTLGHARWWPRHFGRAALDRSGSAENSRAYGTLMAAMEAVSEKAEA
jgi:hypothetical protein